MKPIGEDPQSEARIGAPMQVERSTRLVRIALVTLLVLGFEWRMADPMVISADPILWPTPWAMLFLMFPVALGVWAFEAISPDSGGLKVDGLWGVLVGTSSYVAISLLA